MKIYKIGYKSWNDSKELHVAAKDTAQAVEFFNRHAKKNFYSDVEIVYLEKVLKVDVHYKGK